MQDQTHAVHWFEIPVADFDRARRFYEAISGVQLQELNLANGLKMGVFPTDPAGVGGAICYFPGFYEPGPQGPLLYLNGNPDLQAVLDRVEEAGGKVVIPKRQISADRGYMAVFTDTEGNRLALNSMN